jgi:hypothetical protein
VKVRAREEEEKISICQPFSPEELDNTSDGYFTQQKNTLVWTCRQEPD